MVCMLFNVVCLAQKSGLSEADAVKIIVGEWEILDTDLSYIGSIHCLEKGDKQLFAYLPLGGVPMSAYKWLIFPIGSDYTNGSIQVLLEGTQQWITFQYRNLKSVSCEFKIEDTWYNAIKKTDKDDLVVSEVNDSLPCYGADSKIEDHYVSHEVLSVRTIVAEDSLAADSGQLYIDAEEPARFKGDLNQYIRDNLKYPVVAMENDVTGNVVAGFVVETDGSITNVSVARPVHPSLDKEAVRLVKSMPKWEPARQNGIPVRSRFFCPIKFSL